MRTPLAAWRAGVRWPLALIALVAALVVAVARLRGDRLAVPGRADAAPARRMLDRRVVLGGDGERASGVRIGLLGSVRVRAASIEIGAPAWSPTPHTLLARDAQPEARLPRPLARLARRARCTSPALEAASLDALLERRADGRASWQFGKKQEEQADDKETPLPTFGRLAVGDGHVLYGDEVLPAGVDARFALSDGSAAAKRRRRHRRRALRRLRPMPRRRRLPPASAASGGIVIRAGGAAGQPRRSPTACASRPARAGCA